MDQLSNNFQENQSLNLETDSQWHLNLQLEFSPSVSEEQLGDNFNQCEMSPEQSIYTSTNIQQTDPNEAHAIGNDLIAMPLDVHTSLNQIFLNSLQNETGRVLIPQQRPQLRIKICRSHQQCVICQQQIKRKSVVYNLKCKHYFHRNCLKKWHQKHNTCPLCREELR